jgi:hypothetical protein
MEGHNRMTGLQGLRAFLLALEAQEDPIKVVGGLTYNYWGIPPSK